MVLLPQNSILRFDYAHAVRHYCFFSAWLIFLKNLLKPLTRSNRFFQYVVSNQQQAITNEFPLDITHKMISSLSTFSRNFCSFAWFFISASFTVRRLPIKYLKKSPPWVVSYGNVIVHPRLSYIFHSSAAYASKIVLDVQSIRK